MVVEGGASQSEMINFNPKESAEKKEDQEYARFEELESYENVHKNVVNSVLPIGESTLVSIGADGKMVLIDRKTGEKKSEIRPHEKVKVPPEEGDGSASAIISLNHFRPGVFATTGKNDGTIRFWKIGDNDEMEMIGITKGHKGGTENILTVTENNKDGDEVEELYFQPKGGYQSKGGYHFVEKQVLNKTDDFESKVRNSPDPEAISLEVDGNTPAIKQKGENSLVFSYTNKENSWTQGFKKLNLDTGKVEPSSIEFKSRKPISVMTTVEGRPVDERENDQDYPLIVGGTKSGAMFITPDKGKQDVETVLVPEALPWEVTALAATNDRKIISGGNRGEIKIWSIDKGLKPVLLKELKGHNGQKINSIVVTKEGFVTVGNDGSVRVWGVPDERKQETIA
ncbi:hypothetical protein KKC60_03625 [Patescibacteria group bacterium]|nr:hypothetical protein [Patescibacteria group bacterium]